MFYTRFFAGFVPASGAWRDVRLTVDGVVLSRGGWRGRVRKALAVGGILWAAAGAWAADYVFPGQMPAGCSGSGGNYVCGDLSLKYRDTVRISGALPAKITINGSLDTDTAQVNALGASGNLSLVVSGDVRLGWSDSQGDNYVLDFPDQPVEIDAEGSCQALTENGNSYPLTLQVTRPITRADVQASQTAKLMGGHHGP